MQNYKVFKIHLHSTCGSYFSSYLQSVTMFAYDENDAITQMTAWCSVRNLELIREVSMDDVHEIIINDYGIIDYNLDSDY